MKKYILAFTLLFSIGALAQYKTGESITISEKHNDDMYISGETIRTEAPVVGDLVVAGGTVTLRDSIYQDLLVAGGEITVSGHVADDIRAAGGELTIDCEVGDDVIVAGGRVYITENATIDGNLINFSGEVEINGTVKGMVKSYSGDMEINGNIAKEAILYGEDIVINGKINGKSKIVAEDISIGESGVFYDDVAYWSEDGEVDFKNSLIGATASFDEALMGDREEFSWKGLGIMAFGLWIFYLFSAFLVLLLMNWAFNNFFSDAATNLDKEFLKSLGYGALYIFALPFVVVILFVIVIGIPLGLFLGGFYIFSLLFGHLVAALLLSHYLAQKPNRKWNFWAIVLVALGIAAVIRLFTFIPFLGMLIAIVVIAIGYGLIGYTLLQKRIRTRLSS